LRLFQNSSLYPGYRATADRLIAQVQGFEASRAAFFEDRYGACHILKPVMGGEPEAFFTNGDQELLQRRWAAEQGMPANTPMAEILLAQIEHHRTEVFYNQDPISYPGSFAKRLPGSVKARIAWRAAPSSGADFSGYDLMICNFPGILRTFAQAGLRTAYFAPAADPAMAAYATNRERPIDFAFVGSFTRHHSRRTAVLQAVASLSSQHRVVLHLEVSRGTRLAELPLVSAFVPARFKRPPLVAALAKPPVFGRGLYEVLSRTKVVVNGAIDMSGEEKGNIRCFETLGTGALMLSDAGRYPEGMIDGQTFIAYTDTASLAATARRVLADLAGLKRIAQAGTAMLQAEYSKSRQWSSFQKLADSAAKSRVAGSTIAQASHG